ncbi:heterokaryon incompatibility protein-domain-containing protein [Hypoxylon rubiginosum]|uniref:Heterokaryon incompatibility protein-domain-containing protein n=1 Tax=Hypoxylon rubiginosum TaxID=110542 RepID=A0ACB9YVV5_9PEZI|nr:heterokaryon incompatibility protein-domain-containing protein [Hypoxylon rubiginosum]
MSCVRLVTEAESSAIDKTSGLCNVCKQIYFYYVIPTAKPYDNGHRDDYSHFHIGPLRHVSAKAPLCAGCRLVLAVISSSASRVSDAGIIKIQRNYPTSRVHEDTQFLNNKGEITIVKNYYQIIDPLEPLIEVILESEPASSSERALGSIIRYESRETNDISKFSSSCKSYDLGDGSVSRFHFRGRSVTETLNSDLLKDWIRRCDTKHKECLLLEQQSAPVERSSIRLIDVEERKVIFTSQQEQEYVALSYVWGEGTEGSLTSATVERFSSSHGIPDDLEVIPSTILDAIRLVRDIGFRYLWVDSLCILQDEDHDKLRSLPHMDSIYSCASLVIIAAAGKNAQAGLPGVVHTRST